MRFYRNRNQDRRRLNEAKKQQQKYIVTEDTFYDTLENMDYLTKAEINKLIKAGAELRLIFPEGMLVDDITYDYGHPAVIINGVDLDIDDTDWLRLNN